MRRHARRQTGHHDQRAAADDERVAVLDARNDAFACDVDRAAVEHHAVDVGDRRSVGDDLRHLLHRDATVVEHRLLPLGACDQWPQHLRDISSQHRRTT